MMRLFRLIVVLGAVLAANSALAIPLPYTGTVVNDNWRLTEYSVVRDGERFDSPILHRFDDGQTIDYFVDVEDGQVLGVTASNQQFTLDDDTALFDLINLDIGIGPQGRPTGTLDYAITTASSAISGTFFFFDDHWSGPFNSLNYHFRSGSFYLYLFGGDKVNGISADLAVVRVPEPAAVALMGVGLVLLGARVRRR